MRRKLVLIVLNSTAGGGHLLPLCNYAGQNHPAFVNRIELRLFHVVEFLIVVVLILCFLLCACKQRCCLFGELLLPLSLGQTAWDGFYADWSPVKRFIWFNLLLTGIAICYKRKNGYRLSGPFSLLDLLLVVLFGIYGFIGILAFPLKKSREEILKS